METTGSFIASLFTTLSLVGLAEVGDKSQLVCMALAVRYRPAPVLVGAIVAFALLNLLAVAFGAAVADWFAPWVVTLLVSVLFLAFGIHALRAGVEEEPESVVPRGGHGVLFSTLLLIFMAEFGDKTQVAVAGLAGTLQPLAVWIGATLALAITSALGVWAGRTVLQRLPVRLLHRISGVLFLLMGVVALASLLY